VHDKVRLVTGVRHVRAKMELDINSTLGGTEIVNEQITVTDDSKFDLLLGINFNHWFNNKRDIMLNSDVGIAGDSVGQSGVFRRRRRVLQVCTHRLVTDQSGSLLQELSFHGVARRRTGKGRYSLVAWHDDRRKLVLRRQDLGVRGASSSDLLAARR